MGSVAEAQTSRRRGMLEKVACLFLPTLPASGSFLPYWMSCDVPQQRKGGSLLPPPPLSPVSATT